MDKWTNRLILLALIILVVLGCVAFVRLFQTPAPAEIASVKVLATVGAQATYGPNCIEPAPTCPWPTVTATNTPAAPPSPTPTATADAPAILWDERLSEIGLSVERRAGEYELIAAWLTINGNWDNVPAWAHTWQNDTLGGDHNGFGRFENADGTPIQGATLALTWANDTEGDTRISDATGWNNLVISASSPTWDPAKQQGPYKLWAFGGDKLVGLGLPFNQHYSFFGVWRRRASLSQMDAQSFGR